MRRSRFVSGLLLITFVATGVALLARQQADDVQPWSAGSCYRAIVFESDQKEHRLRVLEAPRGAWVRVQSDPMSPRVPGTSRASIWLNTEKVFALQQIECSTFPHQ